MKTSPSISDGDVLYEKLIDGTIDKETYLSQFYPGDEKLRGIDLDSNVTTSNEFLTCYPIAEYAKKFERSAER